MSNLCFYFQMHQPLRLRGYSVFDTDADYFDDRFNGEILDKVAGKCYLPATGILLDLIEEHGDKFRVSFSVTGVLMEKLRERQPGVIENLKRLAETGCVEFLAETYYHSVAFLYSREEFREQIEKHVEMVEEVIGIRPRVFRNTELIYNNDLAHFVDALGWFEGMLTEGAERVLEGRSPNGIFEPPHCRNLKLLLRNYRYSDDIAFRFSNSEWDEWPLTAEKFAGWMGSLEGDVCNLFMDFETFGEHQWDETGIFGFLKELPGRVMAEGCGFVTVSEAMAKGASDGIEEFDSPNMVSWADTERDLSAWLGNAMQSNALHELFKLERPIKEGGDEGLLEDWRRLTISDHFYYMCTKHMADGDVHGYFSPYESPYDAYINFMNVLDNLRVRVGA